MFRGKYFFKIIIWWTTMPFFVNTYLFPIVLNLSFYYVDLVSHDCNSVSKRVCNDQLHLSQLWSYEFNCKTKWSWVFQHVLHEVCSTSMWQSWTCWKHWSLGRHRQVLHCLLLWRLNMRNMLNVNRLVGADVAAFCSAIFAVKGVIYALIMLI
jgi:hypothetical protein